MRYKKWGHSQNSGPVRSQRRGRVGIYGQTLIEFALALPMLFLLIVNVVNFGGMMHAWIAVSHAARIGGQYLMMGAVTEGGSSPPSLSAVATLVGLDLKGLPNSTSATIVVCKKNTNNSTPVTCNDGSTPTLPSDPESSSYTLGSVDVTYTFTPYVSLWSAFGVNLTTPPTSIHRQCVMRVGGG